MYSNCMAGTVVDVCACCTCDTLSCIPPPTPFVLSVVSSYQSNDQERFTTEGKGMYSLQHFSVLALIRKQTSSQQCKMTSQIFKNNTANSEP